MRWGDTEHAKGDGKCLQNGKCKVKRTFRRQAHIHDEIILKWILKK
jgi:hypothetical protein